MSVATNNSIKMKVINLCKAKGRINLKTLSPLNLNRILNTTNKITDR